MHMFTTLQQKPPEALRNKLAQNCQPPRTPDQQPGLLALILQVFARAAHQYGREGKYDHSLSFRTIPEPGMKGIGLPSGVQKMLKW